MALTALLVGSLLVGSLGAPGARRLAVDSLSTALTGSAGTGTVSVRVPSSVRNNTVVAGHLFSNPTPSGDWTLTLDPSSPGAPWFSVDLRDGTVTTTRALAPLLPGPNLTTPTTATATLTLAVRASGFNLRASDVSACSSLPSTADVTTPLTGASAARASTAPECQAACCASRTCVYWGFFPTVAAAEAPTPCVGDSPCCVLHTSVPALSAAAAPGAGAASGPVNASATYTGPWQTIAVTVEQPGAYIARTDATLPTLPPAVGREVDYNASACPAQPSFTGDPVGGVVVGTFATVTTAAGCQADAPRLPRHVYRLRARLRGAG